MIDKHGRKLGIGDRVRTSKPVDTADHHAPGITGTVLAINVDVATVKGWPTGAPLETIAKPVIDRVKSEQLTRLAARK